MVFAADNVAENAAIVNNHKRSEGSDKLDDEELRYPNENGDQQSNGYEKDARSAKNDDGQPDVVEDHPGKSRSTFNSSHISSLYAFKDSCWSFIES